MRLADPPAATLPAALDAVAVKLAAGEGSAVGADVAVGNAVGAGVDVTLGGTNVGATVAVGTGWAGPETTLKDAAELLDP